MANAVAVETETGLPREFGFWTGLFVVAASMVGGAVLTSGPIAVHTHSNRTMLCLWLVGGVLSLAGALPLAEMATAYPRVGGDYFFIRKAFGPGLAFVFGWATVLCGFAAPIASVAAIASGLLHPALAAVFGDFMSREAFEPVGGSLVIVAFSWAHCLGHGGSAWIHNLATIFKIGVLAVFAIAVLGSDRASTANLNDVLATHGEGVAIFKSYPVLQSLLVLGNSLVFVMYAYVGWNGAVYLAGEIRNPGRLLPLCVIGGCLAVMALYLAINLGYAMTVSPTELSKYPEEELKRTSDLVAKLAFSKRTADGCIFLIGLGVLASVSAFILSGARVVFALANDGLFPAWASRLSSRSLAPVNATWAQGILSLICLWSGKFNQLIDYAAFGLTLLASVVTICIFRLRRMPDYAPAFRVPFGFVVPAIFIAANATMLTASAIELPIPAIVCVASIALGYPLYMYCRKN